MRQVYVVPKSAGFSIPRFKTLGPPWGQMSPTNHGGTRWSSLGVSFGATLTHKGMDPDGRLNQMGVGTIHPRPQTNTLDQKLYGRVKGLLQRIGDQCTEKFQGPFVLFMSRC
jgi:hypothetical protein